MKEYVMSLAVASLLVGIVGVLTPKKHKGHVRLLCGLCMICLLARPLPEAFGDFDLFDYLENEQEDEENALYDEIYHNTVQKANAKKISDALKDMISKDFSLSKEEVSVNVAIEEEGETIVIKKTTVALSGNAVLQDPREIVSYLEDMLGCQCVIVYT